jgi:hypothetical protein
VLCIRARLQSCRKGPVGRGLLAPAALFLSQFRFGSSTCEEDITFAAFNKPPNGVRSSVVVVGDELGELSRKTDKRRAFLTCAIWRCNKLSRVPCVLLNLRNPGDIRGGGLGLGGLWGCFAYASMSDSRYFFLFGTDLSAEPRRGRRTALTLPVGPPPQKNRSRPSDSRPET